MASVTLDNIKKIYPGGIEAVKGLSLTVPDASFTVLLGPSGCGKSTLLRMIAGLETISDGTCSIAGKIVNDVEPADRDIAMVFQNYALYPHMSVYNNMAYGLRNRRMPEPEIDNRVRAAARMLAITDYLDRKPRALSGGQRQRVAMGRAIVREPQVFLFDEPLSNLDAKLRVSMRLEIRRLHNRLKATSIFVTHDQVEAMTLADQVVVMNEGRIEQVGKPADVYRRPATRFVAAFIGAPAMNLLPGRVIAQNIVETSAGKLPFDPLQFPVEAGHSVDVGIRPEDLQYIPPAAVTTGGLTFSPEFVEEFGAGRLFHGRAGEHPMIVTVAAWSTSEPKQGSRLITEQESVHLFDAATGFSLRKGVR